MADEPPTIAAESELRESFDDALPRSAADRLIAVEAEGDDEAPTAPDSVRDVSRLAVVLDDE